MAATFLAIAALFASTFLPCSRHSWTSSSSARVIAAQVLENQKGNMRLAHLFADGIQLLFTTGTPVRKWRAWLFWKDTRDAIVARETPPSALCFLAVLASTWRSFSASSSSPATCVEGQLAGHGILIQGLLPLSV